MVKIRRMNVICMVGVIVLLLSGCGSSFKQDAVPPSETIGVVQDAVDRYILSTKYLPVKKAAPDAGKYEKYPVDFALLQNTLQLSAPPENAYEKGGSYYYVLVQEGAQWMVKLLDMALWQDIDRIQSKVTDFVERNGRLPSDQQVAEGVYLLDADAVGIDDNQVRSLYSPMKLSIVVDDNGQVAIDYAFEIMRKIQEKNLQESSMPSDLQQVLIQNSSFIPVKSLSYRWEQDQPVIDPSH